MPWTAGSTVIVRTLGNKQGVIAEAGASGRYRVRVEGLTMWCREEDLAAVDEGKKRKKGGRSHGDHRGPGHGEHGDHRGPGHGEHGGHRGHGRGEHGGHRGQGHGEHGGHGEPGGYRSRLDLHGLRVEEALARVDDEINRALLNGADRVEIVHGRGTGRIRDAVHRHLASMTVVAAFRLDRDNPGVTWVHF